MADSFVAQLSDWTDQAISSFESEPGEEIDLNFDIKAIETLAEGALSNFAFNHLTAVEITEQGAISLLDGLVDGLQSVMY